MRTNITVSDELMSQALKVSGQRTKRAVVEEALELLIRVKDQNKIRNLRGTLRWEDDLDATRKDS